MGWQLFHWVIESPLPSPLLSPSPLPSLSPLSSPLSPLPSLPSPLPSPLYPPSLSGIFLAGFHLPLDEIDSKLNKISEEEGEGLDSNQIVALKRLKYIQMMLFTFFAICYRLHVFCLFIIAYMFGFICCCLHVVYCLQVPTRC